MKYCRIKLNGEILYAVIEGNVVIKVEGDIFGNYNLSNEKYDLDKVEFLAPVVPKKIVAVGKNYAAHAAEFDGVVPDEPCLFIKPSTSLLDPNGYIIKPDFVKRMDYEGELAVVIKKDCKNVSEEDAKDYILGYTCLNDVTARDIQKSDGQWSRGKAMDTFAPLGPIITDEVNPLNLNIETKLNDETKQKSNTSMMMFNVYNLISFISKSMTLEAGDVVTTGTPEGIGAMKSGDKVEVIIENIGILKNFVK